MSPGEPALALCQGPEQGLQDLPQGAVADQIRRAAGRASQDPRQRGDDVLGPLAGDQSADEQQQVVVLPVERRELLRGIGVGALRVVAARRLQGRQKRLLAHAVPQLALQPHAVSGPRPRGSGSKRFCELRDLLRPAGARARQEGAGVDPERQVRGLGVEVGQVRKGLEHPPPHLRTVDEDPSGPPEGGLGQRVEARVLLDRVLDRAAVRHDGEGQAGFRAGPLGDHRHQHRVVGVQAPIS